MNVKDSIRTIPDFPKPGILFRDVTTLFKDKKAFAEAVESIASHYSSADIDYIAGIESRGFIVGAAVSHILGKGFVPLRKKGKLPGEKISRTFDLEYGTDTIEIHSDAIERGSRVLLIDDLLATGGTALAAAQLLEECGGVVVGTAFIVDLPDLGGGEKLRSAGYSVFALCEFEGE